jgi:hypothetical protein
MDNLELDNLTKGSADLAADLQTLEVIGAKKIRDYPNYITLQKFGTECTINAEWTVVFGEGRVLVKDGKGNEYLQSALKVTVSHQSHASDDLDLVTNRIKFILACCEAASRLKAAHQDKKIYHVWDTVDSRELRAREQNQKIVADFVLAHGKGMRVDAKRSFCDGTVSDILVPGSYEIHTGSFGVTKKYAVTVTSSKVVEITRTA